MGERQDGGKEEREDGGRKNIGSTKRGIWGIERTKGGRKLEIGRRTKAGQ